MKETKKIKLPLGAVSEDGYIICQDLFKDFRYRSCASSLNGCGWMAAYNLRHFLGHDVSMEEICREMDSMHRLPLPGPTVMNVMRSYLYKYVPGIREYHGKDQSIKAIKTSCAGIIRYREERIPHFVAYIRKNEGFRFFNVNDGMEDFLCDMDRFAKEHFHGGTVSAFVLRNSRKNKYALNYINKQKCSMDLRISDTAELYKAESDNSDYESFNQSINEKIELDEKKHQDIDAASYISEDRKASGKLIENRNGGNKSVYIAKAEDSMYSSQNNRKALIEIGSNSIKFFVFDICGTQIAAVVDRTETTRLSQGLEINGSIPKDVLKRNIDKIEALYAEAKALGCTEISSCGTMAMRKAKNAKVLIESVKEKCGFEIRVLSGEEEAYFSSLAAERFLPEISGKSITFDTGGASTELIFKAENSKKSDENTDSAKFIYKAEKCKESEENADSAKFIYKAENSEESKDSGASGNPLFKLSDGESCNNTKNVLISDGYFSISIPVGAVAITEKYLKSDPVTEVEIEAARAAIKKALELIPKRVIKEYKSPARIAGIGGAVTNMASVKLSLSAYDGEVMQSVSPQDQDKEKIQTVSPFRYDAEKIHGSSLSLKDIEEQIELYRLLTIEQRTSIPGLSKKRADIILAGALILDEICRFFESDTITVSDKGLRWGYVLQPLVLEG